MKSVVESEWFWRALVESVKSCDGVVSRRQHGLREWVTILSSKKPHAALITKSTLFCSSEIRDSRVFSLDDRSSATSFEVLRSQYQELVTDAITCVLTC